MSKRKKTTTSDSLDELRNDLASALAHELGVPLRAVEDAVATVTAEWSVDRKDFPHCDDHPLTPDRFGHCLIATLPFIPETDTERTEREAGEAARHWAARTWMVDFDPAVAASGGYPDDDPGPPPERIGANQLLRQGLWWRARTDAASDTTEAIRLADMTHSHRLALLAFLRRNAAAYKLREDWWLASIPGPGGDMASDAFETECDRQWMTSDLDWLNTRPLVRALVYWTTPYGEAPLTWQSIREAPHNRSIIGRRRDFEPEIADIEIRWNGYATRWETDKGHPYSTHEFTQWRELRDDERHVNDPLPPCMECLAPWGTCEHYEDASYY